jgi:hypothetical protein
MGVAEGISRECSVVTLEAICSLFYPMKSVPQGVQMSWLEVHRDLNEPQGQDSGSCSVPLEYWANVLICISSFPIHVKRRNWIMSLQSPGVVLRQYESQKWCLFFQPRKNLGQLFSLSIPIHTTRGRTDTANAYKWFWPCFLKSLESPQEYLHPLS